jgi:hypothetical protein
VWKPNQQICYGTCLVLVLRIPTKKNTHFVILNIINRFDKKTWLSVTTFHCHLFNRRIAVDGFLVVHPELLTPDPDCFLNLDDTGFFYDQNFINLHLNKVKLFRSNNRLIILFKHLCWTFKVKTPRKPLELHTEFFKA